MAVPPSDGDVAQMQDGSKDGKELQLVNLRDTYRHRARGWGQILHSTSCREGSSQQIPSWPAMGHPTNSKVRAVG